MLLQACNIAVFENDSHVEKRRFFLGKKVTKKEEKPWYKVGKSLMAKLNAFFAWNIHKASWEGKWSQNTVSSIFFSGIRFW